MTRNPDRRCRPLKLTTALVAGTLALTPVLTTPAQAFLFGGGGRIVFDPQNHAENILSAARALEQINNQIAQIQNQAQMLMNDALNLASLPHSSLAPLQDAIGETQRLLADAQSLAFDVATIETAFKQDYGSAAAEGDFDAMIAGARDRWETSVAGFEDALRVQAPDEKPVKLTVELPADVHRDLCDYGNVPVNKNNSLYSEELVDLRNYGISGVSYYHISDGTNPPYFRSLKGSIPGLLARKSVAKLLKKVNLRLASSGLELFVWDAYRPLETQIGIWNFFERTVKQAKPELSDQEVYGEVIKYVSDPKKFLANDQRTWPTHMTGASVDLTIRKSSDPELLDMGAHFDQMDEAAFSDHYEKLFAKQKISGNDPRLINRRLLNYVMVEAGFTNYPFEYWHFDWKNQMHEAIKSLNSGNPIKPASYGVVFKA